VARAPCGFGSLGACPGHTLRLHRHIPRGDSLNYYAGSDSGATPLNEGAVQNGLLGGRSSGQRDVRLMLRASHQLRQLGDIGRNRAWEQSAGRKPWQYVARVLAHPEQRPGHRPSAEPQFCRGRRFGGQYCRRSSKSGSFAMFAATRRSSSQCTYATACPLLSRTMKHASLYKVPLAYQKGLLLHTH
jgi:hypothetical protein